MKTLLLKILMLTFIAYLFDASAKAQLPNPQLKIKDFKFKNNPLMRIKGAQVNPGQNFGIKINAFWEDIYAPHTYNSHITQIKVPTTNAVWAKVDYDSSDYDANSFLRSADGGRTWRLDSVDAPAGYGLSGISPVDANTCYAAMYNAYAGIGGGIFKTTDGGDTWKQIKAGSLFGENSFPDIVYFFDALHGIAIGDDDGTDISRLEIYTTGDAGRTWQRVPDKNIPPTAGYAFSSNFNSYAVFQNRFWFTAGDSYGNNYFYRSDDLGQHWQQFPYNLATVISGFAFADNQNGLGVSFDFGVGPHEVETHDGGKTWKDKSYTGYPMGLSISVIPSTHTFVSVIPYDVTPVAGSSYSNDFGASWKLIDSSAGFRPFSVAFLDPFDGWAGRADAQDPKGGMYRWKYQFPLDNTPALASADGIPQTKSNITGLSVYPNPSKSIVNISFSNPQNQKVSVTVYEMNGRLIKTLASEQMLEGFHQLSWNTRDENGNAINTGVYFLRIDTWNHAEIRKLLIEK